MVSVVIPPDSEIVAQFSVSGVRPNGCALVEPSRRLSEEYGVIVGNTSCSGSVLIVNPNAEVVVLPSFTCIGKLVPVAVILVALTDPGHLPEYLEEIVVNPNAEVVVFPSFTCIGKLVPVAVILVALTDPGHLPEYLEEIVAGSHPSLSDAGRQQLRVLLFHCRHVFPTPGELVTGRTTSV